MPATHFRIETATDAAGDGIAALIAAVFSEYEDCPFVESEYSELTAVSQYYHALDGEIWIATSQMDQDVADAMGGGRIVGCLAIVPTLQAYVNCSRCMSPGTPGALALHSGFIEKLFFGLPLVA